MQSRNVILTCIIPFEGANATSSSFDDCNTSSKMLAVPAPTTPILTFGIPAALRNKTM